MRLCRSGARHSSFDPLDALDAVLVSLPKPHTPPLRWTRLRDGVPSRHSVHSIFMPENSFDIVSKIDLQEVSNAIQQALKEIHTRFDLKDSKSDIALEGKDAIVLTSQDDYKLKAVNDVFQQRLVKRGVPLKGLVYGNIEPAASSTVRQRITLQQGIPTEKA